MAKNGYAGQKKLPDEWNFYILGKWFGWTPTQVLKQPDFAVAKLIRIGNTMGDGKGKNRPDNRYKK